MDPNNPYAPPPEHSDSAVAFSAPDSGLTFSEEGWAVATNMAKWMRFVSTVQYVAVGLTCLAVVGFLVANLSKGGLSFLPVLFGGLLAASLLALGATWLRRAARHLSFGFSDNATTSLARGFRNLRLYLILYGVMGLFDLLTDVSSLVGLDW